MSSALPTSFEPNSWAPFAETLDVKHTVRLVLAVIIGGVFFIRFLANNKVADFPLINPAPLFELAGKARKAHFKENSQRILAEGLAKANGGPFNLMTDSGLVTVLPPQYIDLIRDEKGLSFMATVQEDFHAQIPGFEAFRSETRSDALVQSVVRKQLTKSLSKPSRPAIAQEYRLTLDRQSNLATLAGGKLRH